VGNKYSDSTWTQVAWKDPRERNDQGSFYECYFSDIEGNFCAVPKEAFYSVGGFDEDLDKYFGMDFYSVLHRLSLQDKWSFYLDQTNKSYSLEHGRDQNWDKNNQETKSLVTETKNILRNVDTSPYLKISLISQSEIIKYLPLSISPTPKNIYRVHLLITPLQAEKIIINPHLSPIVRNGFTVVELGAYEAN
jgi:hypothetical protein